jgi:hypothetical protein
MKPGVAEPPSMGEPVIDPRPAVPSSPLPTPVAPLPVVTEPAKPAAASPLPRVESKPGVAPGVAAKPLAPPQTAPPPSVQKPVGAPPPPVVAKPERRQAESANSEECNRIVQRLSLGESSPELIERLKALKCR